MPAALCLGERRRDVLQIGRDLGHLLLAELEPLGGSPDFLGVVDRMRRVVAVPRLVEPLLGLEELVVGLGDAHTRGAERGGQLVDLTGRARLDGVVDLPWIAAGGADEFGNTQVDQLRIVRHP